MVHRVGWPIIVVSSRGRLVMRGRTRRHLSSLWRHLQLKRLETWVRTLDCDLYGTGLSPATRTVHCDDTLTLFHRRPPFGTSWPDAGCGRATWTPASGGLSSRAGEGFNRYIPWTNRLLRRLTERWQLLPLHRQDRQDRDNHSSTVCG